MKILGVIDIYGKNYHNEELLKYRNNGYLITCINKKPYHEECFIFDIDLQKYVRKMRYL
jgi:hypothetical protein